MYSCMNIMFLMLVMTMMMMLFLGPSGNALLVVVPLSMMARTYMLSDTT